MLGILNAEQNVINNRIEYYSRDDLAIKLNVSKKTIERWTQARRIPGQCKTGGTWRYRKIDVEKRLLSGNFLL